MKTLSQILRETATATAFLMMCFTSCLNETNPENKNSVNVNFIIDTGTRSSVSASETAIGSFDLYAFCNGYLHDSFHTDDLNGTSVSLSLQSGKEYSFYAIANNSDSPIPYIESEIQDYIWDVSDGYSGVNENGFPMCWRDTASINSGTSVRIRLDRLYSKWTFSLDLSEIPTLYVTSVKMKQVASNVAPFSDDYKASETETTGDISTSTDISALNNGEPVTFYVPENRQGTLLPSNSTSYGKTYDALVAAGKTDDADCCTYLELEGKFDQSDYRPPFNGTITYRFYLGQDLTSNFDVVRNLHKHFTLRPSLQSATSGEIVWEVDNGNVTVNPWGNPFLNAVNHAPEFFCQWGYMEMPYIVMAGEKDYSEADIPYFLNDGSKVTIGEETEYAGSITIDGTTINYYVSALSQRLYYMVSESMSSPVKLTLLTSGGESMDITIPVVGKPSYCVFRTIKSSKPVFELTGKIPAQPYQATIGSDFTFFLGLSGENGWLNFFTDGFAHPKTQSLTNFLAYYGHEHSVSFTGHSGLTINGTSGTISSSDGDYIYKGDYLTYGNSYHWYDWTADVDPALATDGYTLLRLTLNRPIASIADTDTYTISSTYAEATTVYVTTE